MPSTQKSRIQKSNSKRILQYSKFVVWFQFLLSAKFIFEGKKCWQNKCVSYHQTHVTCALDWLHRIFAVYRLESMIWYYAYTSFLSISARLFSSIQRFWQISCKSFCDVSTLNCISEKELKFLAFKQKLNF